MLSKLQKAQALYEVVQYSDAVRVKHATEQGGDPDLVHTANLDWVSSDKRSAFELSTAMMTGALFNPNLEIPSHSHTGRVIAIWAYLREHTRPDIYDRGFRKGQVALLEREIAYIDFVKAVWNGDLEGVKTGLEAGLDPNRFPVLSQAARRAIKHASSEVGPNPYLEIFHILLASDHINPNMIWKGTKPVAFTTLQAIVIEVRRPCPLETVESTRETAAQMIGALLRHPHWQPDLHKQIIFVPFTGVTAIDDLIKRERGRLQAIDSAKSLLRQTMGRPVVADDLKPE